MVGRVTATLGAAGARGDVDAMLSNAHEYLNMFGDTVIAWMWLKQAVRSSTGAAVSLGAAHCNALHRIATCDRNVVDERGVCGPVLPQVAASTALDACGDGSDAVADTDAFYRGKIAAATYFYRVQLPHAHVRGRLLESLDTTVSDVDPAWL